MRPHRKNGRHVVFTAASGAEKPPGPRWQPCMGGGWFRLYASRARAMRALALLPGGECWYDVSTSRRGGWVHATLRIWGNPR